MLNTPGLLLRPPVRIPARPAPPYFPPGGNLTGGGWQPWKPLPPLNLPDWALPNSRPPNQPEGNNYGNLTIGDGITPFDLKVRFRAVVRSSAAVNCATGLPIRAGDTVVNQREETFTGLLRWSYMGGSTSTIVTCLAGDPTQSAYPKHCEAINLTRADGTKAERYALVPDRFDTSPLEKYTSSTVYTCVPTLLNDQPWERKPIPFPPDYEPGWAPDFAPDPENPPEKRPPVRPPVAPPSPTERPTEEPPDQPQDPGERPPLMPPLLPGQKPGQAPTETPSRPGDPGGAPSPGDKPGEGGAGQPQPQPPGWPAPPLPDTAPKPDPKPDKPQWEEDFLGEPIGQPGERPQATPQGTAEMLGKLEQKLRVIGNRLPGPGTNPPAGIPWDALQLIVDLLQAEYPAGSYKLQGPCERQPDGQLKPPEEVTWPGGMGGNREISAKLDALAELLQKHKTMGQPVCVKERQGEPVTVILKERR